MQIIKYDHQFHFLLLKSGHHYYSVVILRPPFSQFTLFQGDHLMPKLFYASAGGCGDWILETGEMIMIKF